MIRSHTSRPSPTLVTLDRPDGPIWRYREDHVLSLLDPEELAIWHAARDRAAQEGLLLTAHALHGAVGHKPENWAPQFNPS